jgi:hypothetical protein
MRFPRVGSYILGIPLFVAGCGTSASIQGTSVDANAYDGVTAQDGAGTSNDSGMPDANNTAADGTASNDASSNTTCGAVGQPCCVVSGGLAAVTCLVGVQCCQPARTCALNCSAMNGDAGADASADAGLCGARDDAGVAHTGSCPQGQYCCDQSHTGATAFVCHQLGTSCPPVP